MAQNSTSTTLALDGQARLAPGVGAANQVVDAGEAGLAQELRGAQRAYAAFAHHQDVTLARNVVETQSEVGLRDRDSTGHVPGGVLGWLAHVDDQGAALAQPGGRFG